MSHESLMGSSIEILRSSSATKSLSDSNYLQGRLLLMQNLLADSLRKNEQLEELLSIAYQENAKLHNVILKFNKPTTAEREYNIVLLK